MTSDFRLGEVGRVHEHSQNINFFKEKVYNEQRSEAKLSKKGLNSFSCPNQLTKVSTIHRQKVNRDIKFDCEKSSLVFSIRLGKVVDQQSS